VCKIELILPKERQVRVFVRRRKSIMIATRKGRSAAKIYLSEDLDLFHTNYNFPISRREIGFLKESFLRS